MGGVTHVHGNGVDTHAHHPRNVAVAGAVTGQPCGGFLTQACTEEMNYSREEEDRMDKVTLLTIEKVV